MLKKDEECKAAFAFVTFKDAEKAGFVSTLRPAGGQTDRQTDRVTLKYPPVTVEADSSQAKV